MNGQLHVPADLLSTKGLRGAPLQSRSLGTRAGPERFGDEIKFIPLLANDFGNCQPIARNILMKQETAKRNVKISMFQTDSVNISKLTFAENSRSLDSVPSKTNEY